MKSHHENFVRSYAEFWKKLQNVSVKFWNNFDDIKKRFCKHFYKNFTRIMNKFEKIVRLVDVEKIMSSYKVNFERTHANFWERLLEISVEFWNNFDKIKKRFCKYFTRIFVREFEKILWY